MVKSRYWWFKPDLGSHHITRCPHNRTGLFYLVKLLHPGKLLHVLIMTFKICFFIHSFNKFATYCDRPWDTVVNKTGKILISWKLHSSWWWAWNYRQLTTWVYFMVLEDEKCCAEKIGQRKGGRECRGQGVGLQFQAECLGKAALSPPYLQWGAEVWLRGKAFGLADRGHKVRSRPGVFVAAGPGIPAIKQHVSILFNTNGNLELGFLCGIGIIYPLCNTKVCVAGRSLLFSFLLLSGALEAPWQAHMNMHLHFYLHLVLPFYFSFCFSWFSCSSYFIFCHDFLFVCFGVCFVGNHLSYLTGGREHLGQQESPVAESTIYPC